MKGIAKQRYRGELCTDLAIAWQAGISFVYSEPYVTSADDCTGLCKCYPDRTRGGKKKPVPDGFLGLSCNKNCRSKTFSRFNSGISYIICDEEKLPMPNPFPEIETWEALAQ